MCDEFLKSLCDKCQNAMENNASESSNADFVRGYNQAMRLVKAWTKEEISKQEKIVSNEQN